MTSDCTFFPQPLLSVTWAGRSVRIGLPVADFVLSRGDRRYSCHERLGESRVRIIPIPSEVQWARGAMTINCVAHARKTLTAAHRRARDDRVLPLLGVVSSVRRTRSAHLRG